MPRPSTRSIIPRVQNKNPAAAIRGAVLFSRTSPVLDLIAILIKLDAQTKKAHRTAAFSHPAYGTKGAGYNVGWLGRTDEVMRFERSGPRPSWTRLRAGTRRLFRLPFLRCTRSSCSEYPDVFVLVFASFASAFLIFKTYPSETIPSVHSQRRGPLFMRAEVVR